MSPRICNFSYVYAASVLHRIILCHTIISYNSPDCNKTVTTILIGVDTGEFNAEFSIEELSELAETAGAEPILKSVQKRPACDSAICVGKGRLLEIYVKPL